MDILASYIKLKSLTLVWLTLAFSISSFAATVDVIKTVSPKSGGGKSTAYKNEVLLKALDITQAEYGAYSIKNTAISMKPKRALSEMQEGELINVAFMAANDVWDEKMLPIKVPIRGGSLSYRLLLIHEHERDTFAKVSNLSDLNRLVGGLQNDWQTTKIFNAAQVNIVTPQYFEGLFLMLDAQRINYIPRAIYEIFDEMIRRQHKLNNVIIEPSLALYVPMVSYLYVSPHEERIAKRLEKGLTEMASNGELKKIFDTYYALDIKRAGLKKRKVITIENTYFTQNAINNDFLWKLH